MLPSSIAISERAAGAQSILGVTTRPAAGDASEAERALASGDGFDVVFDATGSQQAMEKGFDFVAHGGRYVLVSVIKGTVTFMDPDFHRKEMALFGSRNATSEDFERVIRAIRDRVVPIDRLITHRTSLTDAVQQYSAMGDAEDRPDKSAHRNKRIKADSLALS